MSEWRYQVLGPLRVERDGKPAALGAPQARAVLALLLLDAGHVVSADRLIDDLWTGEPPASARVQVQGLVSGLRRALGGGAGQSSPIVTQSPGYLLTVQPGAVDLDVFQSEVTAARELIATGHVEEGAAALAEALDRWTDEPFADVDLPAVREAADRLEELRLAALTDRVDADLTLGRHHALVAELVRVVAEHPLREGFRGQLMVALARSGRVADALECYRDTRRVLVSELGIEPSQQLRDLHAGILRAEPGLRHDAVPPASADGFVPRMLPAGVADFTGRQDAIAALRAVLAADHPAAPPVVAVTGPGGIGKTTLAVHVARALADDYPDGQLFVALGGAGSDPASAGAALARLLRALGIPETAMPAETVERAGLYRSLLAGRRMLVVLDDAAGEAQVRPLLPGEPGCGVLVTSRVRLSGIEGLHPVPVPTLSPADAVALLGRIVGPDRVAAEETAAAAVVQHCAGLPLAVRIVGARLTSRPEWTLADVARRLAGERERLDWLAAGDLAVRASLALSYQQLDADQQRLFRRLGLLDAPDFPGWVGAALLAEGPEPTPPGRAERLLDDLVDRHLVELANRGATGPRYRLHSLVRLAAREIAEASEPPAARDAARDRALAGWLALAGRADDTLLRFPLDAYLPPQWQPDDDTSRIASDDPIAWFTDERAALLVAVRQAADAGRAGLAWPLALRLSSYLSLGSRHDEWRQALEQAAAAAAHEADPLGEACMARLLADVAWDRDEFDTARTMLERADAAYRQLPAGDILGTARLRPKRGWMRYKEDDLDGAVADFEAGLAAAEQLGDPVAVVQARYGLLTVRLQSGGPHRWLDQYEALVDDYRATGSVEFLVMLSSVSAALRGVGRTAEAERYLEEMLHLADRVGNERYVANGQAALAGLYAETGRLPEAADLANQAVKWFTVSGERYGLGKAIYAAGAVARASGDLALAADRFREALGIWRDLGMPWFVRQCLTALTDIYATTGDLDAHTVYTAELHSFQ